MGIFNPMSNNGQTVFHNSRKDWYSLKNLKILPSSDIIADVDVMPDSLWFSGHFPNNPILPAIAQIAMVFEAIQRLHNQHLKISSIKRARFKRIIRPNDSLRIIAKSGRKNPVSYYFRIMVKDELACSGTLILEISDD